VIVYSVWMPNKTVSMHLLRKFNSPMTVLGEVFMSSAKEADVNKLDNPAWLKANHQARTELCV